jgi:hypothetical protein
MIPGRANSIRNVTFYTSNVTSTGFPGWPGDLARLYTGIQITWLNN